MATMGNQVTQIDYARAGIVTEQMRSVAAKEGICAESVREAVAAGRIAIPANIHHAALDPEGVGSCLDGVPLRTKVNVNLGISGDLADEEEEWRKVDVALELGAEAIMD
ncbi:MAG: phosphomethylpyrimidine synthase ThiC, partial [Bacteroidales bacterium]